MTAADFSLRFSASSFQTLGEISPGKSAILPRTTAGSTQLLLDHESFAVMCLLALFHCASYPVLIHRLTVSFHASFPRSVTFTQLHFLSFAVVSLWEDFHLQDRAHAGRTHPPFPEGKGFLFIGTLHLIRKRFRLVLVPVSSICPTAYLHRLIPDVLGRVYLMPRLDLHYSCRHMTHT